MHSWVVRLGVVFTCLIALGCGGGARGSGTSPDTVGATRASREASASTVDPTVTAAAEEASLGDESPRLVLRPIDDVDEAEDGHGATVPAVQAVAFDLDARLVPVASRDPVLHVGGLVLSRYDHPRPGILRFILADRGAVTEGSVVTVQYGDDASTRVIVIPFLDLPWD